MELVYLGLGEEDIKKMRQQLLSCTGESKSKLDELREFYASIGQSERFDYICSTIQKNQAFSEVMAALRKRKDHGDLNNNGVVRMVEGYFTELAFVYAELYRVCKPGAVVAFVNDNVRYGGEVIPVDFFEFVVCGTVWFQSQNHLYIKAAKRQQQPANGEIWARALRKGITVWIKDSE